MMRITYKAVLGDRGRGLAAVLLFIILLAAGAAAAYDRHLDSSAIRNAYFLGTDGRQADSSLAKYTKTPPAQNSAPQVAQIEVRTPFAQVVATSRERSVGYSAQQAEQDYAKDPDRFQVRVRILFSPALALSSVQPAPGCRGAIRMNSVQSCFHDFKFHFTQGKEISPRQSYGLPVYSIGDSSVLIGGDIWFTFRAADVASAPLLVSVSAGGRNVSTEFDLATLR